ncbi:MAG: hypothetical protein HFE91_11565 [Acutalibacter sp.]|jgi:hypothetical protein|uniref:hypothetical protein n=1 Tax=Acutalibacter sp. TaxID=1918636 RepID=UPI002173926A|nr:hypothetical protein [Acutalibacter sp.]MCI9226084.1 hypothetical protein [Acutalibacter sp.]
MIVLYVILWAILGLLLLLLLLTLMPVGAELRFDGEFHLRIKYLFLNIPLLPGEPQEETEEPPKEEEKPEEPEKPGRTDIGGRIKASLKREGLGGFLQALGELISLLGQATAGILRGFNLRHFDLYLCVAGAGDAAAGAELFGKISAGVYSACGVLFTLLPCSRKGVTVDLSYDLWESRVAFSAELSIRPFFVLMEGLKLVIRSIRPLRRILKSERKNKQ